MLCAGNARLQAIYVRGNFRSHRGPVSNSCVAGGLNLLVHLLFPSPGIFPSGRRSHTSGSLPYAWPNRAPFGQRSRGQALAVRLRRPASSSVAKQSNWASRQGPRLLPETLWKKKPGLHEARLMNLTRQPNTRPGSGGSALCVQASRKWGDADVGEHVRRRLSRKAASTSDRSRRS
jgi:hypothetical protein